MVCVFEKVFRCAKRQPTNQHSASSYSLNTFQPTSTRAGRARDGWLEPWLEARIVGVNVQQEMRWCQAPELLGEKERKLAKSIYILGKQTGLMFYFFTINKSSNIFILRYKTFPNEAKTSRCNHGTNWAFLLWKHIFECDWNHWRPAMGNKMSSWN